MPHYEAVRGSVARRRAFGVALTLPTLMCAACAAPSRTPSSSSGPAVEGKTCGTLPGPGRIETLTSDPTRPVVWALYGATTLSDHLARVDFSTGLPSPTAFAIPANAAGPLAVDPDGVPFWLVTPPDGPASIAALRDGTTVIVATNVTPAITRLFWSRRPGEPGGLVALTHSTDADTFSLIKFAVDLAKMTSFTPPVDGLSDAAVTPNGTVVTLRPGTASEATLELHGPSVTTRSVDSAVTDVSVAPEGDRVFFRDGSAVVWSWKPATDELTPETTNDVYAYVATPGHRLATATFGSTGPTLSVCQTALH